MTTSLIAFDFGLKYPLPGDVQTVPRAELSAITTLAEIVEERSMIVYIGDNKPVIDLFHKGEVVCAKSANADLYKLLFAYINNKHLDFTVFWMSSHLDQPEPKNKKGKPKTRPLWVQEHDILGNKEADRLAERAAQLAELPDEIVEEHIDNIIMVNCIQARLATIICNLPHRKSKSMMFLYPGLPR